MQKCVQMNLILCKKEVNKWLFHSLQLPEMWKSIEWRAENQIELSDSRDSDLCNIHDFDGHVIGEVALNFKFTKLIT